MFRFLALVSLLSLIGAQAVADSFKVVSESLQMTEVRVPVTRMHQELVDVAIEIGYRENMTQADYPDFIALKQDLRTWTKQYDWKPMKGKPMASWESLAEYLSIQVIDNYPTINSAALSVIVHPNASHPFNHAFKSTALRAGKSDEPVKTHLSIVLPIDSHGIDHQGPNVIDLSTELHYSDEADAAAYPSFADIYALIHNLMKGYPVESDYWETLVKSMSKDLMKTYPQFDAVKMDMRVYPTATVAYFHNIHCLTERTEMD